jgi:hypothetical protein
LVKLKVLLSCGVKSDLNTFETSYFNIKNLLSKNKGILSEITAKHIILNDYPPTLLTELELDEKHDYRTEKQNESQTRKININENSMDLKTLMADQNYSKFYGKL